MRVSRRTFLKGAGAGGASIAALRLLGGPGTTLVSAGEAGGPPGLDTAPGTGWIGWRAGDRVRGRAGEPPDPRNAVPEGHLADHAALRPQPGEGAARADERER